MADHSAASCRVGTTRRADTVSDTVAEFCPIVAAVGCTVSKIEASAITATHHIASDASASHGFQFFFLQTVAICRIGFGQFNAQLLRQRFQLFGVHFAARLTSSASCAIFSRNPSN